MCLLLFVCASCLSCASACASLAVPLTPVLAVPARSSHISSFGSQLDSGSSEVAWRQPDAPAHVLHENIHAPAAARQPFVEQMAFDKVSRPCLPQRQQDDRYRVGAVGVLRDFEKEPRVVRPPFLVVHSA